MPNVSAVGLGAAEDDIPLLNHTDPDEPSLPCDDFEGADAVTASSGCSSPRKWDEGEEDREEPFEKEEGRCYDDPLWFGKTLGDIRLATDRAKVNGNDASREADWKTANRCWKDALRGAEKLKDAELELRLRLNLALGYTRRGKTDKALEHCSEIFREKLKSVALPELRAKAHFRRAEAYEVAGEESKAVTSLKAALEIEPGNADVCRKLAKLMRSQSERQSRERELFGGKLGAGGAAESDSSGKTPADPGATAEASGTTAPAADAQRPPLGSADAQRPPLGSAELTDRAASARLVERLLGRARPANREECQDDDEDRYVDLPGLNMEVGAHMEIFGPVNPGAGTAAGASAGRREDGTEISQLN